MTPCPPLGACHVVPSPALVPDWPVTVACPMPMEDRELGQKEIPNSSNGSCLALLQPSRRYASRRPTLDRTFVRDEHPLGGSVVGATSSYSSRSGSPSAGSLFGLHVHGAARWCRGQRCSSVLRRISFGDVVVPAAGCVDSTPPIPPPASYVPPRPCAATVIGQYLSPAGGHHLLATWNMPKAPLVSPRRAWPSASRPPRCCRT